MELRHLRYFVAVADAGSVSRAATQLRVTQPALSRQIRDLETELGLPLFDRVGRRLQLTAAGETLLARTRDVLRAAESLREEAGALAGGATGTLRLGATAQTLESLISAFLVGFRRQWPGVDVRLIEDGGMRLKARVQRGELHLALGAVPTGDDLRARPLFPVWVAVLSLGTYALIGGLLAIDSGAAKAFACGVGPSWSLFIDGAAFGPIPTGLRK